MVADALAAEMKRLAGEAYIRAMRNSQQPIRDQDSPASKTIPLARNSIKRETYLLVFHEL